MSYKKNDAIFRSQDLIRNDTILQKVGVKIATGRQYVSLPEIVDPVNGVSKKSPVIYLPTANHENRLLHPWTANWSTADFAVQT